jgi:hypothetical protein
MELSMATIENPVILHQSPVGDAAPLTPTDGYAAVRYNAMKHGILSRLAVLPHEDADEFSALLAALIDEHRPAGMTEQHLVEELAAMAIHLSRDSL